MKVTYGWREYHSDYKELRGNGLIAHIIHPQFCVNRCPTEAFVGVSKTKGRTARLYVPSIAFVWDNEEIEPGNHGVLIYFFDERGISLGGQQGRGAHQFSAYSIGAESKSELIRIASDLMLEKPDLTLQLHEIVTRL